MPLLPPLATDEDVEARLGRPLTEPERLRIGALLSDASSKVRKESTQWFTHVSGDEVTVPVQNSGKIILPQRPVIEVTNVTDLFGNDVDVATVGPEKRLMLNLFPLNSWEREPYRGGITEVIVTYEHGYPNDGDGNSTIPSDIVGVVCGIVTRALGKSPTESGVIQEGIDGYSVAYGSAAAQGGFGMLDSETEVCKAYARGHAPTQVSVRG